MRESVKALPATAPADAFAELKRLQDELQEEIAPLKEKIKAELHAPATAGRSALRKATRSELEQGIALLQGWATPPERRCHPPRGNSTSRQAAPAAADQQAAIDELEKIWDAVIPFHAAARSRSGGPDADRPIARAGRSADSKSRTDEPSEEE